MYKNVKNRIRVGKGYSEEFDVKVGDHQVLSFIIVLEAFSREFHTGCPWEMLYADDLMISAEFMKELLVKLKTWKAVMERKRLQVNMGKTNFMVSGPNLDLLKIIWKGSLWHLQDRCRKKWDLLWLQLVADRQEMRWNQRPLAP